MRLGWKIASVVAAGGGAVAASIAAGLFNPFEPALYRACEEAIKLRLRSPSGYSRSTITDVSRPATREELLEHVRRHAPALEPIALPLFDKGETEPMIYDLLILYDAPNAYGAEIRGGASCREFSTSGAVGHPLPALMEINGQTYHEWVFQLILEK